MKQCIELASTSKHAYFWGELESHGGNVFAFNTTMQIDLSPSIAALIGSQTVARVPASHPTEVGQSEREEVPQTRDKREVTRNPTAPMRQRLVRVLKWWSRFRAQNGVYAYLAIPVLVGIGGQQYLEHSQQQSRQQVVATPRPTAAAPGIPAGASDGAAGKVVASDVRTDEGAAGGQPLSNVRPAPAEPGTAVATPAPAAPLSPTPAYEPAQLPAAKDASTPPARAVALPPAMPAASGDGALIPLPLPAPPPNAGNQGRPARSMQAGDEAAGVKVTLKGAAAPATKPANPASTKETPQGHPEKGANATAEAARLQSQPSSSAK